jgi:hypothetical protein
MKTIRQLIDERDPISRITDQELKESLVGKGAAIAQNRQHAAHKAKLISNLSQIQNDSRRAMLEDDDRKRSDLLFQIIFDLATAFKSFAEMSVNINNISTISVLDTESLLAQLAKTQKAKKA